MKISASILAADFAHLGREVRRVKRCGVSMLHFDVMDGAFVPNISMGVPVLASLKKATRIFMDVHLMIEDPLAYIEAFAKAGADRITFHIESRSDTALSIEKIHSLGMQSGLSLRPGTDIRELEPFLSMVDVVLVMSVEPGFGGQAFQEASLEKVRKLRDKNPKLIIEVDGGINAENAKPLEEAGADELVVGSYLFHARHMKKAIGDIRKAGVNIN